MRLRDDRQMVAMGSRDFLGCKPGGWWCNRLATASFASTAIVNGNGPPFTYQLGQRPDREIRVNVEKFERLNQKKSNAERQLVVDQVAPSLELREEAPKRPRRHPWRDAGVAI